MKPKTATQISLNLTAVVLVSTFSTAVVSKMFGFMAFQYNLEQASNLKHWGEFLSYFLLSIHLSAIVLLCLNRLRMAGIYLSFTLLLSDSIYIGILFSTNQGMLCSCIAILDKLTWKQNLIFSVLMLVLIFVTVGMWHRNEKQS